MYDAVVVDGLTHSYQPARWVGTRRGPGVKIQRPALRDVTFTIEQGEIFCLLGPNGSGKSTLFRILSTILMPTEGSARIFHLDISSRIDDIRKIIGVAFQRPSLDKKLTARENLVHQGHLYNMRGPLLMNRIVEVLTRIGVVDRADDLVEKLSGGLQRRVELAKALLHEPRLLILDEPSTGLDPGARREFGLYLQELRKLDGVTVLLTTHILDEAEKCDHLAILEQGNLVALGTPQKLKNEIGGDVIAVSSREPELLCQGIAEAFHTTAQIVDGVVRIERLNGHEFIPDLVQKFPGKIEAVTLSKPTLDDVFIHKTGHRFSEAEDYLRYDFEKPPTVR